MAVEHVQTKHEIEEMLAAAGVRPRKRFGQHFLIDGNLMRRLVASADLGPNDLVLEVGAGTGGLTDLLVSRAGRVVSVEIDRDLCAILAARFNAAAGFTLIRGDVLEGKHRLHGDVANAIGGGDEPAGGCVKLVANLPYQVATPLVMNLLVDCPAVRRLCFTVQAEVGDRIVARPGGKAFGPLSITSQTLCRIKTIARLPAHVFWPRPTVGSVMIHMDVKGSPFADVGQLRRFVTFVRAVFDHRRKTFRSALAYVVDEATRDRVCHDLDASRRPEAFSVSEWLDIFQAAQG